MKTTGVASPLRCSSAHRSLALFLVMMSGACERAEKIGDLPDMQRVMAIRCIRLTQAVFLVEQTTRLSRLEERTRISVAPPRSLFAPMTVDEFRSGQATDSGIARVLTVLEPGTEISLDAAWRLVSFEGDMLALTARVRGSVYKELPVDVAGLLSDAWRLALSDGKISVAEESEIGEEPPFSREFAVRCESEEDAIGPARQ